MGLRYAITGVITGVMWRSLVALADFLHGEEQDEPAEAHDKLAPLPVGRPDGAKQVLQLLLHRVVAREADLRQLQDVRGVWVRALAVPKDGLHLSQYWSPSLSAPRKKLLHLKTCCNEICSCWNKLPHQDVHNAGASALAFMQFDNLTTGDEIC